MFFDVYTIDASLLAQQYELCFVTLVWAVWSIVNLHSELTAKLKLNLMYLLENLFFFIFFTIIVVSLNGPYVQFISIIRLKIISYLKDSSKSGFYFFVRVTYHICVSSG